MKNTDWGYVYGTGWLYCSVGFVSGGGVRGRDSVYIYWRSRGVRREKFVIE